MKLIKDISLPLLGIFIYTIAPLVGLIIETNFAWDVPVKFGGLVLVFYGLSQMRNVHHRMYANSRIMNSLYVFYVLLLIIMVLRGVSYWERVPSASITEALTAYLCSPYYFMWILMPMVVLRMYPNYSLKGLIRLICCICVICVIFSIFNFADLLNYSFLAMNFGTEESLTKFSYFRMGLEFAPLLPLVGYLSRQQRIIIYVAFGINILACVILARRGDLAMSLLLVVFTLWLYYRRGSLRQKIGIFLATIALLAFFILANNSSLFAYLHERLMLDSRSEVDAALMEQMNVWEKVFGKGLNGKYFLLFDNDTQSNGWRYGSETGFFTIVLKGGFLMVFVYILLMVIPALKGIFNSRNVFCRGGGLYILWNVIYLYPFGQLTFNINFFFVWMWVILCSMPHIRNMSDMEIKTIYF